MQTGSDPLIKLYYDANGKRTHFDYLGSAYYYLYNIQGDVIALTEVNNVGGSYVYQTVCEYRYDSWGNIENVTTNSAYTKKNPAVVAEVNPFRYRGYVYDSETGLYYLQSRYYNPEWGRFVNADGKIDTGTGLLGVNMFAYCNNNPINSNDPNGNAPKWLNNIVKKVAAAVSHAKAAIDKTAKVVAKVAKNVKEDIRNFDIGNTSEEKALQSHYFSSYKGKAVVRLPIGTNAFSFGALFIGSDINANSYDAINTIKHEYGHTQQLEQVGLFNYTTKFFIPSVYNRWFSTLEGSDYYSQPWEVTADMLGGTSRNEDNREHSQGSEQIGWDYLNKYKM